MNARFYSFTFAFWFLLIVVLSVVPDNSPDRIQVGEGFAFRLDYVLHLLIYLPLGFFQRKSNLPGGFFYTLIILLTTAALPETLQLAVPYRTFNPIDLMLNISGAVLGLLAAVTVAWKTGK